MSRPDERPPLPAGLDDGVCRELGCACACHRPAPAELLGAYGIDPGALTPTEVRLAASLLPPGRRVGPVELLRRAWGPGFAAADRAERQALRTALSRLRQKLGRRFRIELVGRGRGYRLRPAAAAGAGHPAPAPYYPPHPRGQTPALRWPAG